MALTWTLVTTLEVRDKASAIEIMEFYKMRWTIELYFKTLKMGCNIESCRMNDGRKLMNYIALQSIFWRSWTETIIGGSKTNSNATDQPSVLSS